MIQVLKKCKKIGVLGGTFNPIHIGHLHIGQLALNKFDLDMVVFIPAGIVPHKNNSDILLKEHRLKLTEVSIEDNPKFLCWDTEINREKVTYTIDTLREFRKKLGTDVEIYYIIGFDVLNSIHTWQEVERIHEFSKIIAFSRTEDIDVNSKVMELKSKYNLDILIGKIKNLDISSTDIRESIKLKEDMRYLLHPLAYKYIKENDLYIPIIETKADDLIELIKERLKGCLSQRRYIHSLGVAKLAKEMAIKSDINEQEAEIAALLHDIGKELSADERKYYIDKYRIPEYIAYGDNRYMLHGIIAYYIGRDEFFINNEDILNSIYFHTSGRTGMTMMERIIFLADKIEPNRKEDFLKEHRHNYEKYGINKAVEIYMKDNIKYLDGKNNTKLIEAYNYMKELNNG